jgi:acyl-CoA reductase-like NAD-dependent aldehyde dehydrogenase
MNADLLPVKKNALLAALAGMKTQSQYITCFDPSTGYHLDTIPADTEFDIAEKVDLARRAWSKSRWAQSSFGDRKRVMRSLLRWVVKNRETCARVACRDTGKTSEGLYPWLMSGRPDPLQWLMPRSERF